MARDQRGTKRVCRNCGARFYDLGRTPIVCPSCETVFQPPAAPARRTPERAAPPKPPPPKVVIEVEDPVLDDAEVISLDDVEETVADTVNDDEVELDDVKDEGKDDDVFLEPDDDEGGDVSDIVGDVDDDKDRDR